MNRHVCMTLMVVALACGSNATWNAWTSWSVCSETCGSGVTYRNRTCSTPGSCSGDDSETLACIIMNYCIPSVYGNTDQNCGVDKFGCASGVVNCVNMTQKCDDVIDCEDGSDENPYFTDCKQTFCFGGATDLRVSMLALLFVAVAAANFVLKI